MKIVNDLDVTFNLDVGTYKPYKKPNNEMKYIHVDSNHPASIIKQIPKSKGAILSLLSSSKEIFLEAAQSWILWTKPCKCEKQKEAKNAKETSYGLIYPILKPWKVLLENIFSI